MASSHGRRCPPAPQVARRSRLGRTTGGAGLRRLGSAAPRTSRARSTGTDRPVIPTGQLGDRESARSLTRVCCVISRFSAPRPGRPRPASPSPHCPRRRSPKAQLLKQARGGPLAVVVRQRRGRPVLPASMVVRCAASENRRRWWPPPIGAPEGALAAPTPWGAPPPAENVCRKRHATRGVALR